MKYITLIKKTVSVVKANIIFLFLYAIFYSNIYAAGGGGINLKKKTLQQLVADFILVASQYVLTILVGLTVFIFLFGLMKYMFKGQGSDTARVEGRQLMLWGVIGIFVITSVWGIVAIFANFFGHDTVVIPQFK